jgi:hypothetical protein
MDSTAFLVIILASTAAAILIAIVIVVARRRSNQKATRNLLDSVERLKSDPNNPDLQKKMLDLMGSFSGQSKDSKGSGALGAAGGHNTGVSGTIGVIATSVSVIAGKSVAQEIEKLGQLLATGVITEAEFQRGKTLYLGAPSDKAVAAIELLENLDALRKRGVLSESEFNTKKWEILSEPLLPDNE